MEWIDVNNAEIKIPFTKVCVWDGGNTFWAYLQRKEISSAGMNLETALPKSSS